MLSWYLRKRNDTCIGRISYHLLLAILKLHALVEYESSDVADKAVSKLFNNYRLKMHMIQLFVGLRWI